MNAKRIWLILLALVPFCALLSQCLSGGADKSTDPRGAIFAGSEKCMKCHSDVYKDFIHTSHFTSSRLADASTVHGSFAAGKNGFDFPNGQSIKTEKTDSGLYMSAYVNGKRVAAHKFDIVFGNKKAETYLYWAGNQLFEMPLSYFYGLNAWTNSPGYEAGVIDFNRPIVRRCFECHSSYIAELPQQQIDMAHRKVEFDKSSLVLGIDCERCHGPGTNHVNFHETYPEVKEARYIRTFKSLTRAQKLDACAVCHSGNKDVFSKTAFVFKEGDTLAKFKEPNFLPQNKDAATLDVHGNQNGLLAGSKCFLMSNMDCTTCHNPHKDDAGNLTAYINRCNGCHSDANHNLCKLTAKYGSLISNKCIDCHMPAKPSSAIAVEEQDGKQGVPYLVRTHYIAIYPEETKKVLAFVQGGAAK